MDDDRVSGRRNVDAMSRFYSDATYPEVHTWRAMWRVPFSSNDTAVTCILPVLFEEMPRKSVLRSKRRSNANGHIPECVHEKFNWRTATILIGYCSEISNPLRVRNKYLVCVTKKDDISCASGRSGTKSGKRTRRVISKDFLSTSLGTHCSFCLLGCEITKSSI